jgi:hypothetical protein
VKETIMERRQQAIAAQGDLFRVRQPMPLPPTETRQRLLRLIGTLLREAASRAPTDNASATPIVEADDKDHV